MRTYSVTFASDRMLVITTNAPIRSGRDAQGARAWPTAFLQAQGAGAAPATGDWREVELGSEIATGKYQLRILKNQIARMAPA